MVFSFVKKTRLKDKTQTQDWRTTLKDKAKDMTKDSGIPDSIIPDSRLLDSRTLDSRIPNSRLPDCKLSSSHHRHYHTTEVLADFVWHQLLIDVDNYLTFQLMYQKIDSIN